MTYNDFMSPLTLAYELYGVELDEELYETYAFSAWRKIGNKYYRLYKTQLKPVYESEGVWYVCKPDNLYSIEAITIDPEYAREQTANNAFAGMINHPIENYIELKKKNKDPLYISGQYIKYTETEDKIYFYEPYLYINLLYKGIYEDAEGYPFLNDKEAEAIATYCAFLYLLKQGIKGKDQASLLLSQILKKDWLKKCDLARIPEDMSQNQLNNILEAATSWNRHLYGQSTKPVI